MKISKICFDPGVLVGVGGVRLTRGAWLALGAVLLFGVMFTMVAVRTAGIYPLPWLDEVRYADPFLNAAEGKGFTSSTWDSQPYGQVWASNSPLYGWIAFPALKLFGSTVEVWRGFWAAAYAMSVVLLLAAAWGLGLLRSAWAVLMTGLLLLLATSLEFLPISGRGVDVACFGVVAGTAAWLAFVPGGGRKAAGLFGGGFLAPWAGLQMIPALACLVVCFLAVRWRPALVAGFWLAAGMVAGFMLMLGVFALLGVAYVYLAKTIGSGFTTLGAVAQAAVTDDAAYLQADRYNMIAAWREMYGSDPVLVVVSLGATICAALAAVLRVARGPGRPGVVLAVLGLVAMPVAMIAAGRFVYYYYWLASVPVILSVAFFLRPGLPRVLPWASAATLLVALATAVQGSWLAETDARVAKNRELTSVVDGLVKRYVGADDRPFVDELAYWQSRRKTDIVWSDGYAGAKTFPRMSAEEKAAFTVVILPQDQWLKARERGKLDETWMLVESVTVGDREIGVWKPAGKR